MKKNLQLIKITGAICTTLFVFACSAKKEVAKKPVETTQAAKPAPVNEKPVTQNGGNGYKYYTIKNGDSLYKIAQMTNTTVDELKRLNNFGAKYSLLPGQKIKTGTL